MDNEERAERRRRLIDALTGNISPEKRAIYSLRKVVLAELTGHLWHTTRQDRFRSIIADGFISPEPSNVPNNERWGTSGGEAFYPYVRSIGGVSLFDFDRFDADSYSEKCPCSSWHEFVPWPESWGISIWIEIDRAKVKDAFISGLALMARQSAENAQRHRLMPHIEAAYIGSLPKTLFKRVLLASPDGMTQL